VPPIQSGCACRGDAGLAHPACRIDAIVAQLETRGMEAWRTCQTCEHKFTGAMCCALASAWYARTAP